LRQAIIAARRFSKGPPKLRNPPPYTLSPVKVHKKQAWKWIYAVRPLQHGLLTVYMDKNGQVKTPPLFGDINAQTPKYTFCHLMGLLFATQLL
jgi:hypothetical protein